MSEDNNQAYNKIFVLCYLIWMMSTITHMLVPPLLPLISEEFQLTYFQAGLTMSVFSLSYAIMQIPAGRLADKFGSRSVIALGTILFSLFNFINSFVVNFQQLLLVRFCVGFSVGMHYAPILALFISLSSPRKRGRIIGYFAAIGWIGLFLAPLIAGSIASLLSWRHVFTLSSLPGVFLTIIFWKTTGNIKVRERSVDVFIFKNLTKTIKSFPFIAISIYAISYVFVAAGIHTFIPTFFVKLHNINIIEAAELSSIPLFAGILGSIIGGLLSDKFNKVKLIISFITIGTFSVSIVTFLPITISAVTLALLGFIITATNPIKVSLLADFSPAEHRGTLIGVINMFYWIGGTLSSMTIGGIIDKMGFSSAFIFAAIVSEIGALPLLKLIKLKKTPKPLHQ